MKSTNYEIPNLAKQQGFKKVKSANDSMLSILNSLNESVDVTAGVADQSTTRTCPVCGAVWTPDTTQPNTEAVCPNCSSKLADTTQDGVSPKAEVMPNKDEEGSDSMTESFKKRARRVLYEYVQLCESKKYRSARRLLEAEEMKVVVEPDGTYTAEQAVANDDPDAFQVEESEDTEEVERFETGMDAEEIKECFAPKKLARTRAIHESRKSSRISRSSRMQESLRKANIEVAVEELLESNNVKLDKNKLSKIITEAYHLNEAEEIPTVETAEDKAAETVEDTIREFGIEVQDVETTTEDDGTIKVSTTLKDTTDDTDVYLGDIADKVEAVLESVSVDYEDPQELDSTDPSVVGVTFYVIPDASDSRVVESEDTNTTEELDKMKESLRILQSKVAKLKESMDNEVEDTMDSTEEESGEAEMKSDDELEEGCGGKKKSMKESEDCEDNSAKDSASMQSALDDIKESLRILSSKINEAENMEDEEDTEVKDSAEDNTESSIIPDDEEDKAEINESYVFAGGKSNVQGQINPAFIKKNQLIYDKDTHTVFKALTESMKVKGGYGLSIAVQNSASPHLAKLVEGANVTLTTNGRYYALKSNPFE